LNPTRVYNQPLGSAEFVEPVFVNGVCVGVGEVVTTYPQHDPVPVPAVEFWGRMAFQTSSASSVKYGVGYALCRVVNQSRVQ